MKGSGNTLESAGADGPTSERTSRVGRRTLTAFVLVMLLATVTLIAGAGRAGSATIPSSFFVVTDSQGANDVPSQSDLTQMGRDDSDPNTYKLFWSWDAVDY